MVCAIDPRNLTSFHFQKMTDPLTDVVLTAAVGTATVKFVNKAWNSGEKWLKSFFEDHHEKAQEKAKNNTLMFITDLAHRVELLERNKVVSLEQISSSQEHPDFSVILKKAIISASQTESKEKHQLLSRLITERIKSAPESLIALTSKMACDAISYTTSNQLKLLGIITNILYLRPDSRLSEDKYLAYLKTRLGPFSEVRPAKLDYVHLEALSCLKFESFLTRNLKEILTEINRGNFDYDSFIEQPLGKSLIDIWEKHHLKSTQLTSIGQIIGVMVSDQVTGASTNMAGWE